MRMGLGWQTGGRMLKRLKNASYPFYITLGFMVELAGEVPPSKTYALAPIATDRQLTTLQSDQVHFFIYTSSGRALKK
jgi:hypothetical protein